MPAARDTDRRRADEGEWGSIQLTRRRGVRGTRLPRRRAGEPSIPRKAIQPVSDAPVANARRHVQEHV